jgi:molecular chaperone IbpA
MNQVVVDTRFLNILSRRILGADRFVSAVVSEESNYPPYNILQYDPDTYRVEIAVTGFEPDEISVEVDQNHLVVRGEVKHKEDDNVRVIHPGLARRNFTWVKALTDHLKIGECRIKNGLLIIDVTREIPEVLKPRVLKIKSE